jgi:hypothetical protein
VKTFRVESLISLTNIHSRRAPSDFHAALEESAMNLVYDTRGELGGGPGLHALIVGVSQYRHLLGGSGPTASFVDLRQLSSAARSAYALYRWLLDRQQRLPIPLASVRLLLSPSPEELDAEPGLAELSGPCGLEAFLTAAYDWRADADTHRGGYTLFYFAGHGIQANGTDTALLLEDFGDGRGGLLRNAVSTQNLIAGMSHSRSRTNTARTQLYFIDTSRDTPAWVGRSMSAAPSPVFNIEVSQATMPDDRTATCFYATAPSARAYAFARKQSLFSRALVECLEGAAARPVDDLEGAASGEPGETRWGVTLYSLSSALSQRMQELSEQFNIDQMVRVDGSDAVINYLPGPPDVQVEISIEPPGAQQFASVKITNALGGETVLDLPAPLSPHPYVASMPAGVYAVSVSFDSTAPPYKGWQGVRMVTPPAAKIKIKVS